MLSCEKTKPTIKRNLGMNATTAMKRIFVTIALVIVPFLISAQNSIKKATAPNAAILELKNGTEAPLETLAFGKEHILRVKLQGGVQNIDHKMYVTSTNAVIRHIKDDQYSVTPVSDKPVIIMVDIETFEDFPFYQLKQHGKKKKMKKVLTNYPPDKYMVSYVTYNVVH
jgi:hypothetical protein